MENEVMEFVKHLPYETHLHTVQEARNVLHYWRAEIPDRVPQSITADDFYKAHILYKAGYYNIDPYDAWVDVSAGYDDDVCFELDHTIFSLRVQPDGIFVQHKGKGRGCFWTDLERITY